jgi:xanthine dehydrogenase YagT iron-sulfur-binding subunit
MSSSTRNGNPVQPESENDAAVSRRSFLKGSGIALSVPLVAGGVRTVKAAGQDVKIHGPNKVSITLDINGKKQASTVEPRVTLLDTLRNELDTTGAKRVCDRGTCGACTVLMDGKPVYACSVLAIEAQGKKISTVESLDLNGKLSPVQQAIVDNDGQQCGFCTPGLTVACTALLNKYPNPTEEQMRLGLGGNLCRCGTYVGIRDAVKQVAAQRRGGKR